MDGWLQILLLVQAFVMGAIAIEVVRHAREHFGGYKEEEAETLPSAVPLSPAMKDQLLKTSEAQFETAVKHSATKLEQDLQNSATQISGLVNRLATDIVADEMARYRDEISRLREQASQQLDGVSKEVTKYQADIKAKMAEEIEAERQRLVKQLDTKLADAVGSFLVETLGHNVDLGSQNDYLVAMLQEHKDEIIKGVADDTPK